MGMLNRILLGAAMSWGSSVAMGLLFAACASGRFSFSALMLPGVIPVALIISTVAAILMTPITVWSMRTGVKNLLIYGSILWVVLAAYVVVIPRTGPPGLYSLFLIAVVGLSILGFIPADK